DISLCMPSSTSTVVEIVHHSKFLEVHVADNLFHWGPQACWSPETVTKFALSQAGSNCRYVLQVKLTTKDHVLSFDSKCSLLLSDHGLPWCVGAVCIPEEKCCVGKFLLLCPK
ncbi:hypothetical protein XENOCAPTIV_004702, partial [Xenoophorus captivus]